MNNITRHPFTYTVVTFKEVVNNKSTYVRESGFGLTTSFTDAMIQLETYYGEDLIKVLHLELLEENDLIIMPESYVKEYTKHDPFDFAIDCDYDGKELKK